MVNNNPEKNLKAYVESLPNSMNLKKKVIKVIMKSSKPLTQKEILDTLESDWTNIKRVLTELLNEGLIMKRFIGTKEYYVKIGEHKNSLKFSGDEETFYFVDMFESDFDEEQKYIRIKQAQLVGLDEFETLGKITIKIDHLEKLTKELATAISKWKKK